MDRYDSRGKRPTAGAAAHPSPPSGPGLRTGAVPFDVQRMLARNGSRLPEYFDAELARQVEQARRNWPLLSATDELDESEPA